MPKPKRRKNLFGFGRKSSGNYIPAKGGIAYHSTKPRAERSSPGTSKSIRSLGKHHIVRSGDGYRVPSLDKDTLFDSRDDAKRFIKAVSNPKRKRNVSIGLPKNQFVNAKVRMKGSKIQVMADERVLGKAGFKAGAGLSGVSVSGGTKLNPKKKRMKVYKFKYGMNWLAARGGRTAKYRSSSEEQALEQFKIAHPEEYRTGDWKLIS